MLSVIFLLLCINSSINGATVPTIVLLPPEDDQNIEIVVQTGVNENGATVKPKICNSDICLKESATMLGSLDASVDPCEDFYEYACGKYIRETKLPEDKAVEISFFQIQDMVNDQLRSILTEKPQPNEPNPYKLAKEFTQTCMDEAMLNKNGITPMEDMLEKYGGWPVVKGNDWKSENWDWIEAKRNILNDGLVDDLILEFSIRPSFKNSSQRIFYVDRPDFGLSERFLLKGLEDAKVKAYYDFMVDAAVIFKANRSDAEHELLDTLQFEIELAKISLSVEERRNISIMLNEFTIQELQTTFPYVNWLEFVNWNLYYKMAINDSEVVIVPDKNYLSQLDALLQITPKRTIANYFTWRLVLFTSTLLNDVLHQRYQQFVAETLGNLKPDPRLMECVKRTMKYLPISVGATYVNKYFNEESKRAATNLANSIHKEFINTLQRVPWMDEETRTKAIKKAKAMDFHIAYSDELVDNNKLEEYYNGLELHTDSLLHSVLRIRKFNKEREISQLREPVNKTDWKIRSTRTANVDAYYSPPENSIQLPAGILQDRFFSADRPSYMNFGAIGWFIGHEITHGFDDEGRQFDYNGNLFNWWQLDTEARFASKAQCFIDQYSNYTHPKLNLTINGVTTQGENIADIGGLKASYAAYQTHIQQNGPDPILPGLNYTANQLFWISAAQLWCAVKRPEYDTTQYMTDSHAPFNYRIIGAFSNSRNFSNDFNCAPNSRMNLNKCEIW